MSKIKRDMLGKEIAVGDIVVHAAMGRYRNINQRLGVVTKINEKSILYSRTTNTKEYLRDSNVSEFPTKTCIKVPSRTLVIGNINGQQPALPHDLVNAFFNLERL